MGEGERIGWLAYALLNIVLFTAIAIMGMLSPNPATIAGVEAVNFACAEDETIFWVDVDTLGCVHIDTLRGE